ncbi:MAG: methyltransferase domain-containing protein, partial [Pirellulales bacterium]
MVEWWPTPAAKVLAAAVRPGGQVIGLDAAAEPLKLAARRSARRPWLNLEWRQGDALATGLEDGWADGAVMAYGLRN